MIKRLTLFIYLFFFYQFAYADYKNVFVDDLDGKKHAMSDYIGKGKWTLVTFWATRCPICIEEMPELQFFHDDHYKKDAQVIGIAIDFPSFGRAKTEEVATYLDDNFITFPIFIGSAKTFEDFGQMKLFGTPTTMVFAPNGKLSAIQVGKVSKNEIEAFLAKQKK